MVIEAVIEQFDERKKNTLYTKRQMYSVAFVFLCFVLISRRFARHSFP